MVASTDARRRALMTLSTVELMVNDLPEVAADWDELSDGERESWSLDWGNEMAALGRLAEVAAEGQLAADDRARFERLVRTLDDALPTIDHLKLRRPSLPVRN